MYKMVDINVEKHTNAKVYTIRVGNKSFFGVRMHNVQEGIGVKNMSDLVKLKVQQKNKSENTIDVKKNWILILLLLLCMFVGISFPEK